MEKALQQRQVRRRISIIKHASQTTQNVAKTCRYYGISRKTFYKWVRRYEEHGESGLCDQSKRPIRFPRETSKEVVSKVLYLRQTYHFGAGRISSYLKRYHEITLSSSTVHSILLRHGVNRLPANQRRYDRNKHHWKRYEKQQPGLRVQVDVKFLERIAGSNKRFYQFTVSCPGRGDRDRAKV